MQHYGKLENYPFIGPLLIKKNSAIEQLLQKNHENVSQPNDLNKNTDTSKTAPTQDKLARL